MVATGETPRGVIRFSRREGRVNGSVVAGTWPAAWLDAPATAGPLAKVGAVLRQRGEALAGHWIFGGTTSAEGQATVALTDAAATNVVLQVLADGPDTAHLTVTPAPTGPSLDVLARAQLAAIDQSYEAFAITDPAGCFTHMNPAHLRLFGFTDLSQVLGKSWTILYAAEQVDEIARTVFPFIQQNRYWRGILPARRQDGSSFSEDLTLTLLPDGGLVCNCRDRSLEIAMQERIERSESLFRNFIDHVPVGVSIKDSAGRYVFVNRQLAELFGVAAEPLLGKLAKEVWSPETAEMLAQAQAEVVRDGRSHRHEAVFSMNGRSIDIEVLIFPVKGPAGELLYLGCIYTDIRQRKRLEQEAAKAIEHQSELIGMQREFVSMVSHEFRTPLTAIQGAHYLLQKRLGTVTDEKVARYLTLESQSIVALKQLVDQVLLLNRLDHRGAKPDLKPLEVASRVSALVEHFNATHASGEARIALHLQIPQQLCVPLDESLFRTAVENMISNALKYSPENKPVTVAVTADAADVCVSVQDQGRGIPPAQRERVFQPFFRASNVGQVPGTGLGLAITRKAIEHHQGRVEFDSTLDVGTTFRLFFPLVSPAAGAAS